MKKLLPAIAVLTLMPLSAYADSSPSGYISLGTGLTITSDSDWNDGVAGDSGSINIKDAENFSGAIGVNYLDNFRTELEVSYRNPDLSSLSFDGTAESASGSFTTWTYLVNEYYDFLEGQQFRPYVSAGIGAATQKVSVSSTDLNESGSDTVFAYQAGLGVSYSVSKEISLWGGYRYLGTSHADFDGGSASYGANEFNVGLRYNF